MKTLLTNVKDGIALVTLNRGRSNALNQEMVTELMDMFRNLENDSQIGAAILTGRDNFFSAGLDLIELYQYNETQIRDFWKLFLTFSAQLIAFKKPLVAAINGHSPAGGCVMAIACDRRVMAEGKFVIGLNEVPVGIVVPQSIFKLFSFWLGEANAYRFLMEGKLFSPEEALRVGLIDELTDTKHLMQDAERLAKKYLSFEPNTWQQSKLNVRKALIQRAVLPNEDELEQMLKQWWSPPTRQILESLISNLQKKV